MWVQTFNERENNLSASVLLPAACTLLASCASTSSTGNRHGPHRSHHRYTTPAKRQRGFPSTFPPPDARPRGSGDTGRDAE